MGNVSVSVEVVNRTRYRLETVGCSVNTGQIQVPARSIDPNASHELKGHKDHFQCTGFSGVAAWKICGADMEQDLNLVILWSAPFNFDYYSNWLAVGLNEGRLEGVKPRTFTEMYYENETWFRRKEFFKDTNPLVFRSGRFEVRGIMGTSHGCEARIELNMVDAAQVPENNFS